MNTDKTDRSGLAIFLFAVAEEVNSTIQ